MQSAHRLELVLISSTSETSLIHLLLVVQRLISSASEHFSMRLLMISSKSIRRFQVVHALSYSTIVLSWIMWMHHHHLLLLLLLLLKLSKKPLITLHSSKFKFRKALCKIMTLSNWRSCSSIVLNESVLAASQIVNLLLLKNSAGHYRMQISFLRWFSRHA